MIQLGMALTRLARMASSLGSSLSARLITAITWAGKLWRTFARRLSDFTRPAITVVIRAVRTVFDGMARASFVLALAFAFLALVNIIGCLAPSSSSKVVVAASGYGQIGAVPAERAAIELLNARLVKLGRSTEETSAAASGGSVRARLDGDFCVDVTTDTTATFRHDSVTGSLTGWIEPLTRAAPDRRQIFPLTKESLECPRHIPVVGVEWTTGDTTALVLLVDVALNLHAEGMTAFTIVDQSFAELTPEAGGQRLVARLDADGLVASTFRQPVRDAFVVVPNVHVGILDPETLNQIQEALVNLPRQDGPWPAPNELVTFVGKLDEIMVATSGDEDIIIDIPKSPDLGEWAFSFGARELDVLPGVEPLYVTINGQQHETTARVLLDEAVRPITLNSVDRSPGGNPGARAEGEVRYLSEDGRRLVGTDTSECIATVLPNALAEVRENAIPVLAIAGGWWLWALRRRTKPSRDPP